MTAMRKLVRAEINAVNDDEVEVVMSTAALARDGHILLPQGCELENYRANPIVLWSHDPDKPIGNADDIQVSADTIKARIRFAPAGISKKADEIRGLMKAGVLRAVSVGFDAIEMEPLDPKKPRGGQRINTWELLELSAVSVPADPGAVVTARANGETTMPIDDTTGQAQTGDAPATAAKSRIHSAGGARIKFTRGLYQVASLCYLFQSLGYQVDEAKWESMLEGDESAVPGMLASVLHDLGEALLAMTQEEVAEALSGYDLEPEDDEDDDVLLVVEDRAHIAAAKTPALRMFRRGLVHAKLRAGKTLSADTVRCLRDAKATHEEGMELHRSAIRKHRDGIKAVDDMMDRAGVSDPDSDTTQTTQTSDGVGVNDGSEGERDADFRRRQVELLGLNAH